MKTFEQFHQNDLIVLNSEEMTDEEIQSIDGYDIYFQPDSLAENGKYIVNFLMRLGETFLSKYYSDEEGGVFYTSTILLKSDLELEDLKNRIRMGLKGLKPDNISIENNSYILWWD